MLHVLAKLVPWMIQVECREAIDLVLACDSVPMEPFRNFCLSLLQVDCTYLESVVASVISIVVKSALQRAAS